MIFCRKFFLCLNVCLKNSRCGIQWTNCFSSSTKWWLYIDVLKQVNCAWSSKSSTNNLFKLNFKHECRISSWISSTKVYVQAIFKTSSFSYLTFPIHFVLLDFQLQANLVFLLSIAWKILIKSFKHNRAKLEKHLNGSCPATSSSGWPCMSMQSTWTWSWGQNWLDS